MSNASCEYAHGGPEYCTYPVNPATSNASREYAYNKQEHMETYRSGHNEAHSKCVCPFRARGFESRRLR